MPSAWNEERVALVRKLTDKGRTATQIMLSINRQTGSVFTRNAIIGRVHRMKLLFVGPAGRHRRRPPPSKATQDRVERIAVASPPPPPPPTPNTPYVLPPSPSYKSGVEAVTHIAVGDCRWPIGDPRQEGFRFCCAPRLEGHRVPYCTHHIRMSAKG